MPQNKNFQISGVAVILVMLFLSYQNCGQEIVPATDQKPESQDNSSSGNNSNNSNTNSTNTTTSSGNYSYDNGVDLGNYSYNPNVVNNTSNANANTTNANTPAKVFKLKLIRWEKSVSTKSYLDTAVVQVQDDFISASDANFVTYDYYVKKSGESTATKFITGSGKNADLIISLPVQGTYYVTRGGDVNQKSDGVAIYFNLDLRTALLRNYIKSKYIANSDSWTALKTNDSYLNCIVNSEDCVHNKTVRINNLYDKNGQLVDSFNILTNGFRLTGAHCNGFNLSNGGSTSCPYKVRVDVTTYCSASAARCKKPSKVHIKIALNYSAPTKDQNNQPLEPNAASKLLEYDLTGDNI